MSEVLELIKDSFPEIDLYELSRVDWGDNIQHRKHYRNSAAWKVSFLASIVD